MLLGAELPNKFDGLPQLPQARISEDWVDYIITKLAKMAGQSWVQMVHGMAVVEWCDIAQGYSAVVCHSPISNLLGLALGLKSNCTVRSFIV
jgi:hypothetical protein